ncbi:MAG: transposase [Saprospiraceae bacterium]
MEATRVYYEQLVHFIDASTDYYISVLLSNKTNAYFKSLNIKTKTDKIDAKYLGLMGIERNLKHWKPMSKELLPLRQLTRNRVNLIETKTAISNRLHAHLHSFNPHKEVIKQLQTIEVTNKVTGQTN